MMKLSIADFTISVHSVFCFFGAGTVVLTLRAEVGLLSLESPLHTIHIDTCMYMCDFTFYVLRMPRLHTRLTDIRISCGRPWVGLH